VATSFMISALAARFRSGDAAAFSAAHPYPWVVWEPGPWLPPGNAASQTMVLPRAAQPGKLGGEALALALKLGAGQTALVLGRGETVDLPVNDATLSRSHLTFSPTHAGSWQVTDQGSSNGSWVDERKLGAGLPVTLRDGAHIQAGQVYLTFYEAAGLFVRIRALR
jgi:hypothetical protein